MLELFGVFWDYLDYVDYCLDYLDYFGWILFQLKCFGLFGCVVPRFFLTPLLSSPFAGPFYCGTSRQWNMCRSPSSTMVSGGYFFWGGRWDFSISMPKNH